MLNNYEAIVKAVLDKTKFDSDMGELVRRQYTLSNIRVDTNNIATEIQNALRSTSFDIRINPVIDQRNAQNIGQNYGQSIANGIRSALNTGINGGGVNLLDGILGGHGGMNQASINRITSGLIRDVGNANVQIRNMRTEFSNAANAANGLRNFRISGVDETGALLTNLTRIDQETGQVASSITTITQNFDNSAQAAREASAAYQQLMTIQGRLDSLNSQVIKLDTGRNSREIAELNSHIERLTAQYQQLRTAFAQNLSTEQLANLDRAIDKSADSLLALQARMGDANEISRITSEYTQLYNTAKQISSLELKVAGLDVSTDANQIRVLESQISELEVTYGNLVTSLNGRLPDDQWRKINDVFTDTAKKLDLIEAKAKDADKAASSIQVITLDNKMSTWLDKNTKASKMFGSSIEDLRNELNSLSSSGNLTERKLKELEERFKGVQQQAIAAGKTGKSFSTTFSNAFQSIAKYISVASIFDATVDSLRNMYDAVYDVDTAMTELIKVADATEETYRRFIKTAGVTAKDIGTTVSEYINSTADFARLGNSLVDSQELAKVANIYKVVGDDIDSIDEATGSIISTMTAFGIATNDAMQIVDKFNKVSNENPISSGGLGEALTKSASSLAAANNSLDQSIALITAANSVVQDPDAVGKHTMPTIKITISVKSQRWSRPRKDFVDYKLVSTKNP